MNPWAPVPMPVLAVRHETDDVVTMRLDASQHPMRFAPGQFTMLSRFGTTEVPISVSGDPVHPHVLQHTIRGVGGVTNNLVRVKKGDVLAVRGPYGTAWPVREMRGQDIVFVAGGIGLAPLRPAILEVLAHRGEYGDVVILYGARSPDEMLFLDDLHAWRGRFDTQVEVSCDRAGPAWRGPVGVVTRLIERARFDVEETVVMTCGPEIMMRFVVRSFEQAGLEHDQIWVSLERNMRCGLGWCGHCQLGGHLLCAKGPVVRYDQVVHSLAVREY